MSGELTRMEYGKSRVRLMKVERSAEGSQVRELAVTLVLRGDFDDAYRDGDNRKIIATDSMKNVVHVLAQRAPIGSIEAFGRRLGGHFLETYAHVEQVDVEIEEETWKPLCTRAGPRADGFSRAGGGVWTVLVTAQRGESPKVVAGIRGVGMLRTTGSSFSGFIRDEFTTLEETASRVLAADLAAQWSYSAERAESEASRQSVVDTLMETFAGHQSRSLQHTLHTMGQAALANFDEIERIWLCLENKHIIAFDALAFGVRGAGEVYTPIDEPRGRITGELVRMR